MSRPEPRLSDVARRGEALYEREFRDRLEPEHTGEFLVLDVETGDHEIDSDQMAAILRAHAKHPDRASSRYTIRIGYDAVHVIGGALRPRGR